MVTKKQKNKKNNIIIMSAGGLLMSVVMLSLLFTPVLSAIFNYANPYKCSSCTNASLFELVIVAMMFFVGAVVFSYGFVSREASDNSPQTGRVISTAVLFSLAATMLYFIFNLYIKGL